jgi:hypothetical protein
MSMEIDIEECGQKAFQMGTGYLLGQMEVNIKEIFEMVKRREMEYLKCLGCFTRDDSKTINTMEKVNYDLMVSMNFKAHF